jgi:uncharacterized protein YcfL
MRNMMRSRFVIGIICTLLCGCVSLNKRSLEKNDVIVFLGDSITQEGVRSDGYVTLTSKVIAKTSAPVSADTRCPTARSVLIAMCCRGNPR